MAIKIDVKTAPPSAPQTVDPERIGKFAALSGTHRDKTPFALTVPDLEVDKKGLVFDNRAGRISVRGGTLVLTIQVFELFSNKLSACQRGIWQQHEQGHVNDYRGLAGGLAGALQADPAFRRIAEGAQSFANQAAAYAALHDAVGAVFRRMVHETNRRRDTREEYIRVARQLVSTCTDPYHYEVVADDNLSTISEMFYGTQKHALALYRENKAVIGDNPHLIKPGQKLLIPQSP